MHLQDPCALEQAGLPPFLRNCITAIHTDTWFVVDGQTTDCCRTTAGSRPGDCFADTVFGFLWARVLRSLEEQFVALDLLEHFSVPETFDPFLPTASFDSADRPFLGPCWMDDLAIPVAATTPAALVRKMGVLAGLLLDQCVSYAMTPNLAAGKSEILLALRGAGSRRLRQQFHGAHGGRQFPIAGEHGGYHVKVVTRYRHPPPWRYHPSCWRPTPRGSTTARSSASDLYQASATPVLQQGFIVEYQDPAL